MADPDCVRIDAAQHFIRQLQFIVKLFRGRWFLCRFCCFIGYVWLRYSLWWIRIRCDGLAALRFST